MNQISSIKHVAKFPPNSSFSKRESLINEEVTRIMQVLKQRGFYPLDFEITNKTASTATISVNYKILG